MRDTLLVSDIHLGVQRMAGTTPMTQIALEQYLQDALRNFLMAHTDKDLIIAGDLFDEFLVNNHAVLQAYRTLAVWLDAGESDLYLVPGNHDIGKRSDRPSSFQFLCQILVSQYPDRVQIVWDRMYTIPGITPIHMIPHCMNQDLFDIELENAREADPGYLLLHANCASPFAEHSDHSLNVSDEWLAKLSRKHTVCFAHEHQKRVYNAGHKDIHVLGNQWPSSIADCLAHGEAQKNGKKFAHVIRADGTLEPIPTWERNGSFVQADWQALTDVTGDFVRITGTATAAQSADVASAVTRFRSKSDAFVVVNSVRIEGIEGMEQITEMNLQAVKSFDVYQALLEVLSPAEQAVINDIMGE